MGFDTNNPEKPIVELRKKTTQVNVWMCLAGVLCVIAAVLLVRWYSARHPTPAPTPPEARTP